MTDIEKHSGKESSDEVLCKTCDDEIDLVQLFLIITKRKKLILAVVVLCLLVGGAFALLRPKSYEYLTVVEVGRTIKNMETGDTDVIEPPSAVLEKVKMAYIPLSLRDKENNGLTVVATSPKNSQLIVLKSSGMGELENQYQAIHAEIAESVIRDHGERLNSLRQQLKSQINKLKNDLAKLQSKDLVQISIGSLQEAINQKKRELAAFNDEVKNYKLHSSLDLEDMKANLQGVVESHKLKKVQLKNKIFKQKIIIDNLMSEKEDFKSKIGLLSQENNLLNSQVAELDKTLLEVQKERLAAPSEARDPADALTLMMVENQLAQYRTRKEALEYKIAVDLVQKNNTYNSQLVGLDRKISTQGEILGALQLEFELLDQAHAREIDKLKSKISQLNSEREKHLEDYTRKKEVKNREILDAANKLTEYKINHDFAIAKQKETIAEAQAKLEKLQPTRTLGLAVRSKAQKGPRKALIIVLAGMLGLMGGIMLAFIAEFMDKVKAQRAV